MNILLILILIILIFITFFKCNPEHFLAPITNKINDINPMCIDETSIRDNEFYNINNKRYVVKCKNEGGWYPNCEMIELSD